MSKEVIGYRLRYANRRRKLYVSPNHTRAVDFASEAELFSSKEAALECRETCGNSFWKTYFRVVRVVRKAK